MQAITVNQYGQAVQIMLLRSNKSLISILQEMWKVKQTVKDNAIYASLVVKGGGKT